MADDPPSSTISKPKSPPAQLKQLKEGDLVIARMKGWPGWPARVMFVHPDLNRIEVFFYGTYQSGTVAMKDAEMYSVFKERQKGKSRGKEKPAMVRAIKEIEETPELYQKYILDVPASNGGDEDDFDESDDEQSQSDPDSKASLSSKQTKSSKSKKKASTCPRPKSSKETEGSRGAASSTTTAKTARTSLRQSSQGSDDGEGSGAESNPSEDGAAETTPAPAARPRPPPTKKKQKKFTVVDVYRDFKKTKEMAGKSREEVDRMFAERVNAMQRREGEGAAMDHKPQKLWDDMTVEERREHVRKWKRYRHMRLMEVVESEEILTNEHFNVRSSLTQDNMNAPAAVAALKKLADASSTQLDELTVIRNPDFVKTIFLCRKFASDRQIRSNANRVYTRIFNSFAHVPGQSFPELLGALYLDSFALKIAIRKRFPSDKRVDLEVKWLVQQLNERELNYPRLDRDPLPIGIDETRLAWLQPDAPIDAFRDVRPLDMFEIDESEFAASNTHAPVQAAAAAAQPLLPPDHEASHTTSDDTTTEEEENEEEESGGPPPSKRSRKGPQKDQAVPSVSRDDESLQ